MAKPYPEQVEEILERFNFRRMARVMQAEGWCWGDSNVPPTLREVREAARLLLEAACTAEPGAAWYLFEGGGLVVLRREGVLHLWFAACGWDGK